MIRFDERVLLNVSPCKQQDATAGINAMKASGKRLPFVILDEMNIPVGGEIVAAVQRIVLRVCGLVVIVMGTDGKALNAIAQCGQSRAQAHHLVSLVPRLPPFQVMLRDESERKVWTVITRKYSVEALIATHSRGLFVRFFMKRMIELELCDPEMALHDRLDDACGFVRDSMCKIKRFLSCSDGWLTQLTAISYGSDINDQDTRPAKRPRLQLDTTSMHLYFANL